MKTVLTYGTFDLFHVGHLTLLERLAALGDKLIVGVSTDEFNSIKGKQSLFDYQDRARIVNALQCVDQVISEDNWEQKVADVEKYNVSIFGIGEDWRGRFDHLEEKCEVVYLPRTQHISTTTLKKSLSNIDKEMVAQLKNGLDGVMDLIKMME